MNAEDQLRRFIINRLICHCRLDFAELKTCFDIDAAHYFSAELAQLAPMQADGLLTINNQGIYVHNKGRLLIRRVCMVFDEYLQKAKQDSSRIRYSKII